jgi:hypothetical protein
MPTPRATAPGGAGQEKAETGGKGDEPADPEGDVVGPGAEDPENASAPEDVIGRAEPDRLRPTRLGIRDRRWGLEERHGAECLTGRGRLPSVWTSPLRSRTVALPT